MAKAGDQLKAVYLISSTRQETVERSKDIVYTVVFSSVPVPTLRELQDLVSMSLFPKSVCFWVNCYKIWTKRWFGHSDAPWFLFSWEYFKSCISWHLSSSIQDMGQIVNTEYPVLNFYCVWYSARHNIDRTASHLYSPWKRGNWYDAEANFVL